MELPGLLSVLLYEDCYSQAVAEEPRLRVLALANGTNAALQIYLNYINKTKQSPNPEHLKSLANMTPQCGEEVIADGYTNYEKLMPFSYNGLHFHSRYEGKCWNYLNENLSTFRPYINDKTLFWIVGSEPKSCISKDVSSRRPASLQASFQPPP